jgi:hypothetical protein
MDLGHHLRNQVWHQEQLEDPKQIKKRKGRGGGDRETDRRGEGEYRYPHKNSYKNEPQETRTKKTLKN